MKPSGKFVLRVEPDLHRRLKQEAEADGVSLNQWIVSRLERPDPHADNRLIALLREQFGKSLIGLTVFGSYVRKQMRSSSDIDLLLVIDRDQPVDRALYLAWDQKIAPHISNLYSPQFSHLPDLNQISSLWLEVSLEGQILWQANGDLQETLSAVRQKIAQGQYVRRTSHGHPYWIRQKESK